MPSVTLKNRDHLYQCDSGFVIDRGNIVEAMIGGVDSLGQLSRVAGMRFWPDRY
jgi:hypothetical protein